MSGSMSGGGSSSAGGGTASLGGILQRLGNTSGGPGSQFQSSFNPAAQYLPQTTPQPTAQDPSAQKTMSLKDILDMLSGKKQG